MSSEHEVHDVLLSHFAKIYPNYNYTECGSYRIFWVSTNMRFKLKLENNMVQVYSSAYNGPDFETSIIDFDPELFAFRLSILIGTIANKRCDDLTNKINEMSQFLKENFKKCENFQEIYFSSGF